MSTHPADLVQLARDLGYVAADLDARGYVYAGGVQQAARVLLALAGTQQEATSTSHGKPTKCRRCGAGIEQKPTGRTRLYCSAPCRKGRTKPGQMPP